MFLYEPFKHPCLILDWESANGQADTYFGEVRLGKCFQHPNDDIVNLLGQFPGRHNDEAIGAFAPLETKRNFLLQREHDEGQDEGEGFARAS